jgi:hypothetical protein
MLFESVGGLRSVPDLRCIGLFMATDIIGELSFGESFRMLEAGKVINKQERLKIVSLLPFLRSSFSPGL